MAAHRSIVSENCWTELDTWVPSKQLGIAATAKLDRADRLGPDAYQIIDWKTGKFDFGEVTDAQLDIAHLVLRTARKLKPQDTVTAIGWNLRTGDRRVRPLTRDDAAATMRYLGGRARQLQATTELKRRRAGCAAFATGAHSAPRPLPWIRRWMSGGMRTLRWTPVMPRMMRTWGDSEPPRFVGRRRTRRVRRPKNVRGWLRMAGQFDVVFLGTGSPLPSAERCGAGNVIAIDGANVLVDCGWGAARRLMPAGVMPGSIDIAIFTHMRKDHMTDFPDFLFLRWTGGATRPLRVLGPKARRRWWTAFSWPCAGTSASASPTANKSCRAQSRRACPRFGSVPRPCWRRGTPGS